MCSSDLVFWGYGLHPERDGDAVAKPMYSRNGDEILEELAHHLRLPERAGSMFEDAVCIPCVMPHITAQFMPRYPVTAPPYCTSPGPISRSWANSARCRTTPCSRSSTRYVRRRRPCTVCTTLGRMSHRCIADSKTPASRRERY